MRPEPVFDAPWHAQLFAMTVHLNELGVFSWPDWAQVFGATLKTHGLTKELNGGEDYFQAWLEALQAVLCANGLTDDPAINQMQAAWERAYLSTPHGQPVKLTSPL